MATIYAICPICPVIEEVSTYTDRIIHLHKGIRHVLMFVKDYETAKKSIKGKSYD